MKKLKESVSTRTKVKVIRAIESGIRMQSVAETLGLSLDKVKEIQKRANADIKAEIGELEQYGSVQALVDRIESMWNTTTSDESS